MSSLRSATIIAAALGIAAAAGGCAGARSSLVMPDSRYPVSMSNGMYGPNEEMLLPEEMEKVGEIFIEETAWGMFYSLAPLTPEIDISAEINRQVAARKGDGVIRLRTEATPCPLDYFFVLTFIPFWPGCTDLEIRGDIIRYRGGQGRAAAPAPAAPPTAAPTAAVAQR